MKINDNTKLGWLLFVAGVLLFNGCVSHGELINFNEGANWTEIDGDQSQMATQIKIQKDDILRIRVYSIDPESVAPFNPGQNITQNGAIFSEDNFDYLVDNNGHINFPELGALKLAGMTTIEARDLIVEKLKTGNYLKEPIVDLRLKNFKVSVMGEVKNPQSLVVQEESITLLEALSRVGDLTTYANRSNILIIRENGEERNFARLNLHSRDIFKSPYFYLQQNDVIYVEPLRERTASISDQTNKILPWASIAITVTTLIVSIARN